MKRVAIIGAGPAGLVSAKECLDQGLDVTIFEKTDRLGGLWNAGVGVWSGMRTNLSKDSCAFPDFPWSDDTPLFPTQAHVLDYLQSYANHFGLLDKIKFNTPVHSVSKNANWELQTDDALELFDHVIIGSGFFNTPHIPKIDGIEHYNGEITHSSRIKPFSEYEGRNVVVIGNAFSGCDIAVGLAHAGANVTQIYRRPVWILTRELNGPNGAEPIDSAFYRVPEQEPDKSLTLSKKYRQLNDGMSHLCAAQNAEKDALYVDPDSDAPPHVSVTDGYIEAVRSGAIDLKQMQYIEMEANGLRGVDGCVDEIIFATGFETHLPFLNKEVQEAIHYDPQDRFLPLALHEGMWSEELKDIAFVGMYRGPFFLTMALQAKWAARAFKDPENFYPSQDDVKRGVADMLAMKALDRKYRPQFPIGDYVGYVQRLAKEAGCSVPYQPNQRVLPSDFDRIIPKP